MRFYVIAILVIAGAVLACQSGATPPGGAISSRPIVAVATTGMIADLVAHVGGARVRIDALMGPGVDPHLYRASEGDVRRLSEADIIFYNGLHLEGAMAEVFHEMASRRPTVAVTDGIDRSRLTSPPEFQGNYDPHIWFDVMLWADALNEVERALSSLDTASAHLFAANAQRYRDSLTALHSEIGEWADRLPAAQRVLVTAHDAFGYFGRAYGFEVRGLQGISTATEAGTADVQQLAEFIATRRVPAIFVESSVPPRTIEAVQAAVKARGFAVAIGGELYSDAMGSAGTPEGMYLGMVRHNVRTIVTALSSSNVSAHSDVP